MSGASAACSLAPRPRCAELDAGRERACPSFPSRSGGGKERGGTGEGRDGSDGRDGRAGMTGLGGGDVCTRGCVGGDARADQGARRRGKEGVSPSCPSAVSVLGFAPSPTPRDTHCSSLATAAPATSKRRRVDRRQPCLSLARRDLLLPRSTLHAPRSTLRPLADLARADVDGP